MMAPKVNIIKLNMTHGRHISLLYPTGPLTLFRCRSLFKEWLSGKTANLTSVHFVPSINWLKQHICIIPCASAYSPPFQATVIWLNFPQFWCHTHDTEASIVSENVPDCDSIQSRCKLYILFWKRLFFKRCLSPFHIHFAKWVFSSYVLCVCTIEIAESAVWAETNNSVRRILKCDKILSIFSLR